MKTTKDSATVARELGISVENYLVLGQVIASETRERLANRLDALAEDRYLSISQVSAFHRAAYTVRTAEL